MVKEFPFKERLISDGTTQTVFRIFKESVDPDELMWHWDEEDRIVHVIRESDWLFQFDNLLPQSLTGVLKIPKGTWHRVIKGNGDLSIIIEKMSDI